MTKYGLISDAGDNDNHLIVNDDDSVDTVGQTIDPYLHSYVSIPAAQDVSLFLFIVIYKLI